MFSRDQLSYKAIPLPDRFERSDEEIEARARTFCDLMSKRHTVREFSPRAVPQGVIEACIQAAGFAPSGANHQPWHFVAISSPEMKRQIRLAAEEEERQFYAGGGRR